jgi:GNAT superfamily N-acetyltransferase
MIALLNTSNTQNRINHLAMGNVKLEPMTDAEFESFLERETEDFATQNVDAGQWLQEEASAQSRTVHASLLPDGNRTANHFFLMIREEGAGKDVGTAWFAISDRSLVKEAFVYYLEVFEAWRGKGFGVKALLAIERKARELGASKISLHAFWHNQRAISLYKKVGYAVKSVNMSKRID